MIRALFGGLLGVLVMSGDVSAQDELDWLARFQVKFRDLSSSACFDELEKLRSSLLSPSEVPAENLEAAAFIDEAIQRNCEHAQYLERVTQKQRQLNAKIENAGLTRDQAQTDARFVHLFEELFDLDHKGDGLRNSSDRLFRVAYNMDPGLLDDWLDTLVGGKGSASS